MCNSNLNSTPTTTEALTLTENRHQKEQVPIKAGSIQKNTHK